MEKKPEHIQVEMIRKNLEDIAQYQLPRNYQVQWYQPGYDKLWLEIHYKAETHLQINQKLFDYEFGEDEKILGQRQCFIFNNKNEPIATATAWFNDNYDSQNYGRVHWVAVVPKYQGKNLAKPLLTNVCNRLIELGHDKAYLVTSSERTKAINLYHKFGFKPAIRNTEELRLWQQIQKNMKEPFTLNYPVDQF